MRVRRGSGGREEELIRRAARLRERVDPLLPRLTRGCPTARFDRLRADLEEVRGEREDEARLEKRSRRGDDLPRAYAGLLRFYLDPELPALLVARYASGEIPYAPLSKASPDAEIAVQSSDDPTRLLLGYLDWARKGFHFFATDTALYCTGPDPTPPEEFKARQLAGLSYRLGPATGGGLACPHLAAGAHVPGLAIDWPSAGTSVAVCHRCAKGNRHLLGELSARMAIPDPETAFPIRVSLNVACESGPACPHHRVPPVGRSARKRYQYGRLADRELIEEYEQEVRPLLARARDPLFVAAGVCYGSDRARFVEALHPTDEERSALARVLPEIDGYFEVDEAVASRALERLWPEHAETIVSAIVPDPERAARLVRDARSAPGRVSELLHRASRATRERATLEALPTFDRLSPEATYLDSVARAFRAQGAAVAEKRLLELLPREGKQRGIGYGLLVVLGREGAHSWQFTDTEQTFGRSLESALLAVLRDPAAEYHRAIDRALRLAGVAEWGRTI